MQDPTPLTTRRGALKCLAFGGAGTLFALAGGVFTPLDLAVAADRKGTAALGKPLFVQISDTHIGFNKEANPDVTATLNRTIDERKPWILHREGRNDELDALLYDLCEGLRWLAVLLHPVMPERTAEMWRQIGSPGEISEDWSRVLSAWGGLEPGTRTAPPASLFPKIESVAQ